MPDYKEMYLKLFRATTEAIEILQQAQQQIEEEYISATEPNVIILSVEKDE